MVLIKAINKLAQSCSIAFKSYKYTVFLHVEIQVAGSCSRSGRSLCTLSGSKTKEGKAVKADYGIGGKSIACLQYWQSNFVAIQFNFGWP